MTVNNSFSPQPSASSRRVPHRAAASAAHPQPPRRPLLVRAWRWPKPAYLLRLRLRVPVRTVGHFQTNEAMTRRRRLAAHGAPEGPPSPPSLGEARDPECQLPSPHPGPPWAAAAQASRVQASASPRCPSNGTLSRGASSQRWGQQEALEPSPPSRGGAAPGQGGPG